jgi:Ca2+-binding RTX toxin-like protein
MALTFSPSISVSGNIGVSATLDYDYLFPKAGISIFQGYGHFWVNGTDGSDTIYMNFGGSVYAGSGNDKVIGWNVTQSMNIYGERGDDTIWGGSAGDFLDGGDHNDWIDAGLGNDTVIGGNGRDTLNGGGGNDRIEGGTGNDTLISGGANYNADISAVMAGDFAWVGIWGKALVLIGQASNLNGADLLIGGLGNDTLRLNGANVVAAGGNWSTEPSPFTSGFDRFVCEATGARDNYLIIIGDGGGSVDLSRMGTLTGYTSEMGDGAILEQFSFGADTVLVHHDLNASYSLIM